MEICLDPTAMGLFLSYVDFIIEGLTIKVQLTDGGEKVWTYSEELRVFCTHTTEG